MTEILATPSVETPPPQATPRPPVIRKSEVARKAPARPVSPLDSLARRVKSAEEILKEAKEAANRLKRERALAKLRVKRAKKEAKEAQRSLMRARNRKAVGNGSAEGNGHRTQLLKASKGPVDLKGKNYEKELRKLQAELCYLQDWVKAKDLRVMVIFEGRDAAGKAARFEPLRSE